MVADGALPRPASAHRPAGDRLPYFFLSHAPGEDHIFVSRFFDDLSAAVRGALDPADGEASGRPVGFLDSESAEGADPPRWPADTRAALTTCQTFIALWSTRYVLSEHCGRAWSVFGERLSLYHRRTGQAAPSLIPLVWSDDRVAFRPPAGVDQDVRPHLSPNGEDLRVLIRLTSQRPAYRAFLGSLARRIVDTTRRHQIPPGAPGRDLATAANAFARWPGGSQAESGTGGVPSRVSFAVIAGTREQMRPVRTDLASYGDRREDWAPYRPTAPQPVTDRARAVAAARQLGSDLVPIDAVPGRIGAARRRNELVVLLIDAWATQLEELRTVLREVNERHDDTVAVLVPVSRDDPETAGNRGVLRAAIQSTFADRSHRRDPMFHPEVSTADRFDTDLAVAIVEGQNRLYRLGPPAGDTPAGGIPASDTPAGGIPAGDTPAGGIPAGDTPAGGIPAGAPPSGTATAGTAASGPGPADTGASSSKRESIRPILDGP